MVNDPIVVGTDGSVTATRAVEHAGQLARALGADVHVVTTYDTTTAGERLAAAGGVVVTSSLSTLQEAQARAEAIAEAARAQLEPLGITVYTHVCSGEAAETLVTIADDRRAQMIVVGNRGMSGARRLLGSVPNRVSHSAHCGVLIVPTAG